MQMKILERALKEDRFNDIDIVDMHCHMGPWYNFYFPKADISEMVRDADIFGIRMLCTAPHASISCDYKLGNEIMLNAVEKYPGRVAGLLTLNANMEEETSLQFDKYYRKEGVVGVKIHPSLHQYRLDDIKCNTIYEKVRGTGGFILVHTWESDPKCDIDVCGKIIDAYPEVAFILAHAGGTGDGVEKAVRLVNKYENAYLDTSGFEFSDVWIEELVCKADKTKVLFGSDCPFHDLRSGISRILFADINDDIKSGVLGRNFRNLLSRYGKRL